MPEDFYKDKCWELIINRLDEIDKKLESQSMEIGKINIKLASILGWAAGAGAVAGIVFAWVKDKLFTKI